MSDHPTAGCIAAALTLLIIFACYAVPILAIAALIKWLIL